MINIEICNSYIKGKFKLRIGDIEGSTEQTNATFKEVIDAIKEEMEKMILESQEAKE